MILTSDYLKAEATLADIGHFRINPSIDNIRAFLEESKLKPEYPVVQVSGTNGKTSTSVFLAAIFSSAGKKTGLYLSPHVFHFGERVAVSGKSLSPDEFGKLFLEFKKKHEDLIKKHKLTQFEMLTAFSVWHFNEANVEMAVFETGLGGRFDAVSALNAETGVLTGIHFDHTELLGNSMRSIAFEKLFPFSHKKVFILQSSLSDEIREVAEELQVSLEVIPDNDLGISISEAGTHVFTPFKANLKLTGNKYARNAFLSLKVAEKFGFAPNASSIEGCIIPARFQKIRLWNSDVVLDGSHNPQAISVATETFKIVYGQRDFCVVCGFMKDKDYEHMIELIRASKPMIAFLVPIKSAPERSAVLFGHQDEVFRFEQNLESAVKKALSYTNLILVTGSLYLCGDFIRSFSGKIGIEAFGYNSDGSINYY